MNAHLVAELLSALATPQLLGVLLLGQVIQIASIYVASKLVAGATSSPVNALRCYGFQLGAGLLIALVIGILTAVLVALGGGGLLIIPLVLGVSLGLYSAVAVPMYVYDLETWSAVGLLIVASVASFFINAGVHQVVPARIPPEVAQKMAALSPSNAGALAALRAPASATVAPSAAPAPPSPVFAKVEHALAPNRPLPAQVTVAAPVRVPIKLDGRVAGDVELEPGTKLKVVADDGDYVKVMNLDTVVRVPKDKLSY